MVLLTWCANLSPAAEPEDLRDFLETQAESVREALAPPGGLGLGLWFPAGLAARLARSGEGRRLAEAFAGKGFFLATVNAFPMGRFHGPGVKEKVYFPSWASRERLEYTLDVFEAAALLGREGAVVPVSTLPLGWARSRKEEEGLLEAGTAGVLQAARAAREIGRTRGADLVLALEPEPGCLLETAEDFFDWFEKRLLPRARREGLEAVCRRRIGLCLDLCHQAVLGEEPGKTLAEARRRGIRVGKAQLSSALEVRPGRPGWRQALEPFAEPAYLHQVTWWEGPGRRAAFFRDLPEALEAAGKGRPWGEEAFWRVHFHLPLFWEGRGPLAGTAPRVLPGFLARKDPLPPVLEVETYTWRVLPWVEGEEQIREGVVRELEFAASFLNCGGASPGRGFRPKGEDGR